MIKGDATIPGHGWELLKPLPPVIGIAERVGHTAALATHQSAFIGVWLAIKTLGVAPWQHEKPEGRYAYQRNLVVTVVSLRLGRDRRPGDLVAARRPGAVAGHGGPDRCGRVGLRHPVVVPPPGGASSSPAIRRRKVDRARAGA